MILGGLSSSKSGSRLDIRQELMVKSGVEGSLEADFFPPRGPSVFCFVF